MKRMFAVFLGVTIIVTTLCGCHSREPEQVEKEALFPCEYAVEEFSCKREEMTIRGKAFIPSIEADRFPAVILSHGFCATMAAVEEYATGLVSNGYAAVIFDFCGGSVLSSSDGKTTEMSILTLEEDLKAVFNAVSELSFVNPEQIYLMGTSQGGLVSAMAAADLQDQVSALMLVAPGFSIPDNVQEMYSSADEIPDIVKDYLRLMTVGRCYFEAMLDYDVFSDVTRYTGPVLIFHGTADEMIPCEYSQCAQEKYATAELVVLEGAGHRLTGDYMTEAEEKMVAFLGSLENEK